jgi:hypothetical protein
MRMMRMFQVTSDIPVVELEERLPKPELGTIAEAVRRALPELRKLERFARRAIWSRNRALMLVAGRGAARKSG